MVLAALVNNSRPINPTGIVGLLLALEPQEKRGQKTVPATNVQPPGRRNLCERLGNEPRSGETVGDNEGDTCKK